MAVMSMTVSVTLMAAMATAMAMAMAMVLCDEGPLKVVAALGSREPLGPTQRRRATHVARRLDQLSKSIAAAQFQTNFFRFSMISKDFQRFRPLFRPWRLDFAAWADDHGARDDP